MVTLVYRGEDAILRGMGYDVVTLTTGVRTPYSGAWSTTTHLAYFRAYEENDTSLVVYFF